MQEQMESSHKNGTWELVKPPPRKKVALQDEKCIVGIEEARYKARLVAQGYNQNTR